MRVTRNALTQNFRYRSSLQAWTEVGEALADFGSLIAMGMIAFPSPQSPRGQVVVFNYQKWVCVGEIGKE